MLKLLIPLFVIFISINNLIAQPFDLPFTYPGNTLQEYSNANLAGPENVLVVYKNAGDTTLITTSRAVKDYYVGKRNIPSENIFPLTIPSSEIYQTGTVILDQGGELIRNADDGCLNSTTSVCDIIAWLFFVDHIANPIQNYLNTTVNGNGDTLKNVIRYIVLCKGVPHKVRSGHIWIGQYGEWAHRTRINVSTDALLCLINNEEDIITLYNNPPTPVTPPLPGGIFSNDPVGGNPYYNVDPNFNFNHRFVSNHYITNAGWKLNYLVSRLDGKNLEETREMIDRSYDTDYSGTGTWILDGGWSLMYSDLNTTNQILTNYGFNTVFDNNYSNWLTTNPTPIIGYTSGGFNVQMSSTYILDTLDF
jgi:hypothetical protein